MPARGRRNVVRRSHARDGTRRPLARASSETDTTRRDRRSDRVARAAGRRLCYAASAEDAMALRIVVIGQAAFGEQVFIGLRARGHDVAAVYAPPDTSQRPDALAAAARAAGISCRQPPSYKTEAV